ncbi:MAG: hypothetical protein HY788_02070 [Deltaproteobacteria bacterium]|nr:hypothetical protein [Deltaproteobacteria bacterium]
MAGNFNILMHISGSNLHLRLTGDFDGSSAYELINLLKTKRTRFSKVFIHTNGLKKVLPFGKEVFRSQSGFKQNDSAAIIFTGECAPDLALGGSAVTEGFK